MKLKAYKFVIIAIENLMKKLGKDMFLFVKKRNKRKLLNNQLKKENELFIKNLNS